MKPGTVLTLVFLLMAGALFATGRTGMSVVAGGLGVLIFLLRNASGMRSATSSQNGDSGPWGDNSSASSTSDSWGGNVGNDGADGCDTGWGDSDGSGDCSGDSGGDSGAGSSSD